MLKNGNLNIITSCDNNLAKFLPINLLAISQSLSQYNVNFYLLYSSIDDSTLQMIDRFCKHIGTVSFCPVFVENSNDFAKIASRGGGWVNEAYFSLVAHKLLPKSCDRALYIDAADTLIISDISDYYNYDFNNNFIIATAARLKDDLKIFNKGDLNDTSLLPTILRGLFNSGSYVLNLKALRRGNLTLHDFNELSDAIGSTCGDGNRIYFGDQGFLSAAFAGMITYYNYPQVKNIWYMPYDFCLWYYDRMKEKPDYMPHIIHFAGAPKPWLMDFSPYALPLIERFQNNDNLRQLSQLKLGQAEYYLLWYVYAMQADKILSTL